MKTTNETTTETTTETTAVKAPRYSAVSAEFMANEIFATVGNKETGDENLFRHLIVFTKTKKDRSVQIANLKTEVKNIAESGDVLSSTVKTVKKYISMVEAYWEYQDTHGGKVDLKNAKWTNLQAICKLPALWRKIPGSVTVDGETLTRDELLNTFLEQINGAKVRNQSRFDYNFRLEATLKQIGERSRELIPSDAVTLEAAQLVFNDWSADVRAAVVEAYNQSHETETPSDA